MNDHLVVVQDLRKAFVHMGTELEVLRGIDLTIRQGEVMAIVGPSGAGKSTLMHCIGTLDLPTTGSILFDGKELVGLTGTQLAAIRNASIGFVFQFHHLLPEFNALENVMMPGLIQGRPRAEMAKLAGTLLEEVGLGHRLTHRPGELSGGEQQRVALARALVLEPKMLLADEPTGNLDSTTSEAMHKLFFDINQKHGTTVVVVTHNNVFAQSMPRVVRMVDGRIDSDTAGPPSRRELDPALMARRKAMARARPGEFWGRAVAKIIDIVLMNLLTAMAGAGAALFAFLRDPLAIRERMQELALVRDGLAVTGVLFLMPLFYQTLAEWLGGATLGKLLLGYRVRSDASLGRCTLRGAFLRNLGFLADGALFGLIGYMAMSGSMMRQRIGDRVGGTVVVQRSTVDPIDSERPALGLLLGTTLFVIAQAGVLFGLIWALG